MNRRVSTNGDQAGKLDRAWEEERPWSKMFQQSARELPVSVMRRNTLTEESKLVL